MTETIIAWAIIALMLILSVVLLSGRGAFLIAGYNTSSPNNKAKYNEKRLCRVIGGGLGTAALIMAVAAFYDFEMPVDIEWLMPWGYFAVVAITIILGNTVCKIKP